MLVGIAAKNGVLIVEFINQLRDRGMEFRDAIVEAAAIRLRPGDHDGLHGVRRGAADARDGAGRRARQAIGVVMFSGVIVSVFLTLFIVPAVYAILARKTRSPQHVSRIVDRLLAGGERCRHGRRHGGRARAASRVSEASCASGRTSSTASDPRADGRRHRQAVPPAVQAARRGLAPCPK